MTFPLPLVPFEHYMVAEDTADYPRAFIAELRLSGPLNRTALETAWRAALSRHPMLGALLVKTRKGWHWTAPPDVGRSIDWGESDAPLQFNERESIDLTREPGVRLWVRHDDSAAHLVFQFHHACCDGVAGFQFTGDLLAAYARETTGADSAPDPVRWEHDLLKQRGSFGLTRPTLGEWLGHAAVTLGESIRLLWRRNIPVSLPRPDKDELATPLSYPGLETHTLSREETQALRRTAERAGATVNDLLLCDLFQTILQWNRQESQGSPRGWLRINVPTNLRRRADLRMPAANVMSFTFVDRRASDCHDTPALLESISADMDVIKSGRRGLYFIAQLALLGKIPGGMRLVLGRRRCYASAVLTNLGEAGKAFRVRFPRRDDKLVIGNLVLESLAGAPPLRELTRVGVAVATYAGQLTLSLLCDRRHFTREQSRRFLQMYLGRIRADIDPSQEAAEQVARLDVDRGAAVDD